MREHDALGLRRRARREDDLGGGVGLEVEARAEGRASGALDGSGFDLNNSCKTPDGALAFRARRRPRRRRRRIAFASTIAATLPRKSGRRAVVDRHDDHALEQRAPQRGDPFRPVLAPDRDRLAVRDAARPQRAAQTTAPAAPAPRTSTSTSDTRRRRRETPQVSVLSVALVPVADLSADPVTSRKKSSSVRRVMSLNYDGNRMTLPPVFAASALYDNLLQAALRQFFDRATFETVATPSLSSDGRLAIEPTGDPSALVGPLVRHAARAQRAVAASVHRARGAAGARDRRGAGGALSRDFRPQADGRARRPLSRRHRGPLRRGLSRRGRVQPSAEHRAESCGSRGERDRGAARGGALQLREPRDFVRRAVARYRCGSVDCRAAATRRPIAIRSR